MYSRHRLPFWPNQWCLHMSPHLECLLSPFHRSIEGKIVTIQLILYFWVLPIPMTFQKQGILWDGSTQISQRNNSSVDYQRLTHLMNQTIIIPSQKEIMLVMRETPWNSWLFHLLCSLVCMVVAIWVRRLWSFSLAAPTHVPWLLLVAATWSSPPLSEYCTLIFMSFKLSFCTSICKFSCMLRAWEWVHRSHDLCSTISRKTYDHVPDSCVILTFAACNELFRPWNLKYLSLCGVPGWTPS